MKKKFIVTIAFSMIGCKEIGERTSSSQVYTLYRNSPIDKAMRIHMASFDANEKEGYNKENCEIGRDLFMNQPGVTAEYWCEKGYFKK